MDAPWRQFPASRGAGLESQPQSLQGGTCPSAPAQHQSLSLDLRAPRVAVGSVSLDGVCLAKSPTPEGMGPGTWQVIMGE